MRLDRNTNPDGRGKYALINLRDNRVQWGGQAGEQFFVLKYKDKFAAAALSAYAQACREEAKVIRAGRGMTKRTKRTAAVADELDEFARDIEHEAGLAAKWGYKLPD